MTVRMRTVSLAVLGGVVLSTLSAAAVLAQTDEFLEGKLRLGNVVSVAEGETVRGDLYVFAGTVTINGDVEGDLVAAGGQVLVSGTIDGDVVLAGGTLVLTGEVDGDARLAGGQITAGGEIGEDLLFLGGQASLTGRVGADLVMAAGQVNVDGSVEGSIAGSAGSYERRGSVGGTEQVTVTDDREERAEETTGERLAEGLRQFIVVVLFGAIGLWLLPRGLRASADALRRSPLLSLGSGVITLIGYVVALAVSVIVIVLLGILFGLLGFGALVALDVLIGLLAVLQLTLAFVLGVGFVADVVVGLALGRLASQAVPAGRWQELALLAAGALAVVIATSLPVIGGWLKLAVILFGLGAVAVAAFRAWGDSRRTRRERAAAGAAP